jgi:nucleotidyltransferase/DNA polymerase involved in DNA repair
MNPMHSLALRNLPPLAGEWLGMGGARMHRTPANTRSLPQENHKTLPINTLCQAQKVDGLFLKTKRFSQESEARGSRFSSRFRGFTPPVFAPCPAILLDGVRAYMYSAGMIGHLDADCFYVSCERIRAPALRNQPVGVLGNQGACVIAKSYEMKARGVKTGVPIWDAVKLCPEGIYVKRDFRWYEVISRQLLHILKSVSPTVEYYSIDEMFFDARGVDPQALQRCILDQVGVPVSMGVSRTKTLAKLISDTAKPFGCRVVREPDLTQFAVDELTGIGERSRVKLAAHGIKTCQDLAQADRHLIRRLLTIKGEAIWWELHGEPVQPIVTKRPAHKCISRGGSIGAATDDRQVVIGWIVRNVERLVEELHHYRVVTGRLVLIIEAKTGDIFSSATPLTPSASFKMLVSAAKLLFERMPAVVVAAMHLLAEQLSREIQLTLFDTEPDEIEIKEKINSKLGRFAVRSGETLFLDVYGDTSNDFDICDVRGKMCF